MSPQSARQSELVCSFTARSGSFTSRSGQRLRRSEKVIDTEAIDTEAMWERASGQLQLTAPHDAGRNSKGRDWLMRSTVSVLVVTAASLLLIFSLSFVGSDTHDTTDASHNHASLAADFAEVFRSAQTEPQKALATLSTKYDGRQLGEEETTKYLGYEPALLKSLPTGITRVSIHVLNMPCCRCSATICERSNGTSLIVFEHKDEQLVWFGDSPSIETECAGMPCRIIESAGKLAASWRNQDRQMTIVGANDLAEVNQWVNSLKL